MFDLVFQSGHDVAAMILCAGLMFALFAVAHLTSIAFPPNDGKPQRITVMVSRVCLIGFLGLSVWFSVVAFDYMKLSDLFGPGKNPH